AGTLLRLSVGDSSPVQPQWVPHSATATTGRGLMLIAALSRAYGVEVQADGSGKVVWCEIDVDSTADDAAAAEAALAAQWASVVDELARPALPQNEESEATTHLQLLNYPVRLGVRMREHRETVLRELQLLSLNHKIDDVDTAAAAEDIRQILDTLYGHLTSAEARNLQALAAGLDHVDLSYARRPDHQQLIDRWRRCMSALEQVSARGDLSHLATPVDIQVLEQWIADELSRQLAGARPLPWRSVDSPMHGADLDEFSR
ncbi:ATP-binding protein, partial [Kineococcus glutinatus]|uniref:ATP-binding protein n=1 Tax=Kineococcus glutinatus TaxID=1070872 RepID=UPI0031EB8178